MLTVVLHRDISVEDTLIDSCNTFSFDFVLHLSARKLEIAPHRARLPGKNEFKMKNTHSYGAFMAMRVDDIIILHAKKKFYFYWKKMKKIISRMRRIGGN